MRTVRPFSTSIIGLFASQGGNFSSQTLCRTALILFKHDSSYTDIYELSVKMGCWHHTVSLRTCMGCWEHRGGGGRAPPVAKQRVNHTALCKGKARAPACMQHCWRTWALCWQRGLQGTAAIWKEGKAHGAETQELVSRHILKIIFAIVVSPRFRSLWHDAPATVWAQPVVSSSAEISLLQCRGDPRVHFQFHLASAGAAGLVQGKLSHLLQLITAGTYFYLSGVRFCSATKGANEKRKAHNARQHHGYITSPQVEVLVAHPLLNTYLLPEPVPPRNLRMPRLRHHSSSNTITV